MAGARVEIREGKQMIFIDFANCSADQMLQVIAEASPLIRSQPLGTALILSDFTSACSDPRLLSALREFTAGNEPYVRASAIVGMGRVARIFYDIVMKFTGRDIPIFADVQQAAAWLLAESGHACSPGASDPRRNEEEELSQAGIAQAHG